MLRLETPRGVWSGRYSLGGRCRCRSFSPARPVFLKFHSLAPPFGRRPGRRTWLKLRRSFPATWKMAVRPGSSLSDEQVRLISVRPLVFSEFRPRTGYVCAGSGVQRVLKLSSNPLGNVAGNLTLLD